MLACLQRPFDILYTVFHLFLKTNAVVIIIITIIIIVVVVVVVVIVIIIISTINFRN